MALSSAKSSIAVISNAVSKVLSSSSVGPNVTVPGSRVALEDISEMTHDAEVAVVTAAEAAKTIAQPQAVNDSNSNVGAIAGGIAAAVVLLVGIAVYSRRKPPANSRFQSRDVVPNLVYESPTTGDPDGPLPSPPPSARLQTFRQDSSLRLTGPGGGGIDDGVYGDQGMYGDQCVYDAVDDVEDSSNPVWPTRSIAHSNEAPTTSASGAPPLYEEALPSYEDVC